MEKWIYEKIERYVYRYIAYRLGKLQCLWNFGSNHSLHESLKDSYSCSICLVQSGSPGGPFYYNHSRIQTVVGFVSVWTFITSEAKMKWLERQPTNELLRFWNDVCRLFLFTCHWQEISQQLWWRPGGWVRERPQHHSRELLAIVAS